MYQRAVVDVAETPTAHVQLDGFCQLGFEVSHGPELHVLLRKSVR